MWAFYLQRTGTSEIPVGGQEFIDMRSLGTLLHSHAPFCLTEQFISFSKLTLPFPCLPPGFSVSAAVSSFPFFSSLDHFSPSASTDAVPGAGARW